jgi:hypothetical protein
VRITAGIGSLLVAGLLAACAGGADGTAEQASDDVHTSHAAHAAQPAAVPSAATGAGASAEPGSPAEAALKLESLVGQHSILAADMMRARIRSDDDLAQAANAALGKNTTAMGDLLEPVIGAEGVKQFEPLWSQHISLLFNYARGLGTKDTKVQKDSRAELISYEETLAKFFVAGSKGRLDKKAALTAVREHVDHLLDGADAYAKGDREESVQLYRDSYAHSFGLGEALARALLPASVGKQLDKPANRLRAALTRLLGEHVALVVATMRATVADTADQPSLADAVNANTQDLAGAIDALFGAAAAKGFQDQWADHCDELMAYAAGVADKDPTAREAARKDLQRFEQTFATFLDDATEHRLGQPALAQAYVMHDRMLTAQIDSYGAKDYTQAHDLGYQTYDEMFTVSGQLSDAIGSTVAKKLPTGGSATGGGGMAGHVSNH